MENSLQHIFMPEDLTFYVDLALYLKAAGHTDMFSAVDPVSRMI